MTADTASPDGALAQARAAAADDDLARAEAICRGVLASHPEHAPTLAYLGLICHHADRHGEAERLLQRAVAVDQRTGGHWLLLGVVLRALERLAEAEAALRQALALNARLSDGYLALGALLFSLGRGAEAQETYQSGLEQCPEMAELQLALGNTQAALGDAAGAVATLRRAALDHPPAMAPSKPPWAPPSTNWGSMKRPWRRSTRPSSDGPTTPSPGAIWGWHGWAATTP